MSDGIDIGGQSRRFQAAVIVVTMVVLLAGALAAATIDTGSLLDIAPGGNTSTDNGGFDRAEGPVNNSSSTDSGGGAGGGTGGGGGGVPLPGFIADIIGGVTGGGEPADEETVVPPPPYNITVGPEPTPGGRVVVTVEKSGEPVPFAVVAVDGEQVGRTDLSGQLVTQVPYRTSMRVTARPPPEASSGLADPRTTRLGAPATALRTGDAAQNSSVVYNVSTDVAARVRGVALPGERATVRFSVASNPLPRVNVTVDGTPAGVTDRNGTVEVGVPADATPAGSVPLAVSRGGFENDTEIELGELAADVETGLLALPGTGATVTVRAVDSTDERTLDGVPVTVTSGDEQVAAGETDANGTMSFGLPWANSATVTATGEHGTVSVGVSGLFLSLGGVVLALALPVAGVAVWLRRNRETRRRARNRVVGALVAAGSALDRAGRRVLAFLRGLPVVDSLRRVRHGLVRAAGWLRGVLVAGGRRLAGGLARALGWVGEQPWLSLVLAGPLWLLGRLRAGLVWLVGLPSRLRGDDNEDDTDDEQRAGGREQPSPAASTGGEGSLSAYERLRRSWRWLVGRVVGRSRARTLTPAEIERRALEQGLPADPVRRLRRAFQDVEYGPADAEECVEDAEDAREHIRGEQ